MTRHYCHNCRHYRELPDDTYCAWCLNRFNPRRRDHPLPLPDDPDTELTAIQRLYAALDAMEATSS